MGRDRQQDLVPALPEVEKESFSPAPRVRRVKRSLLSMVSTADAGEGNNYGKGEDRLPYGHAGNGKEKAILSQRARFEMKA